MEIPRCIGTPVGEQVYSYFLSNFVQGTSLRNHGYLDFLFPLLANEPPGRDHPLPLAFSATAMIAFAARQKVPELLPRAEATYLRALEATFQAIGDPKKARDNSTLACVTLLTTFEVSNWRRAFKSAISWSQSEPIVPYQMLMRHPNSNSDLPGRRIQRRRRLGRISTARRRFSRCEARTCSRPSSAARSSSS